MTPFEPSLIATDAAERERFIAALRETGSYTAASRLTGHARQTVYQLRRRDGDFAAACAAALGRETAERLETALLTRAIEGVERTRTFADGRVEQWREYDNKLAFALLARLVPAKFGATAVAPPPLPVMTRAEFIAAIEARPATVAAGE